jgi:hypothetical protein
MTAPAGPLLFHLLKLGRPICSPVDEFKPEPKELVDIAVVVEASGRTIQQNKPANAIARLTRRAARTIGACGAIEIAFLHTARDCLFAQTCFKCFFKQDHSYLFAALIAQAFGQTARPTC